MTKNDWNILEKIKVWLLKETNNNQKIVLWICRASNVFNDCTKYLPVGSIPTFESNIKTHLKYLNLPFTENSIDKIAFPSEFCYRLKRKLLLNEIAKVELVDPKLVKTEPFK